MDLYSRNKFLIRIFVVLIFLNLLSIGYLWWQRNDNRNNRPPKRDSEKTAEAIKEKLQLNDVQGIALKNIREDFFRKEDTLSRLIKQQRDSMNTIMFKVDADTLMVYKIARRVAENEYKMETFRINQAQQLRMICTDSQLKKLEDMVKDIRDYFQPEKKNNDKPKK